MAESSPKQKVELLTNLAIIDPALKLAAFIDIETTGLNPEHDEILEFGILLFAFDPSTGEIAGIVDEYVGLQEPEGPIHRAAAKVNRITWRMVRDQALDHFQIARLVERAEFLVSHNAAFDNRFIPQTIRLPPRPWLCSMDDIPWSGKDFPSKSLQNLIKSHCIDSPVAHRAGDDCRAAVTLLSLKSAKGKTYLSEMIEGHAERERRMAAENAERERRTIAESAKSRWGCLILLLFLFIVMFKACSG